MAGQKLLRYMSQSTRAYKSNFEKITYSRSRKGDKVPRFVLKLVTVNPKLWKCKI